MNHLIDFQTLHQWHDSLYSYLFPLKVMGASFGRRMIVVRSPDEKLLLLSPMALGPTLKEELRALGEIRTVVFPTRFHDTGAVEAIASIGSPRVFASFGLEELIPNARLIETLGDRWREALDWQLLEGMPKVNEIVFRHKDSNTLLPSDLLYHFTPEFSSWTRALARVSGAYPEVSPSRLFSSYIKDGEAFLRSLDVVLKWEFERVLPSHADVIEHGGRESLEAFRSQRAAALSK